MYGGWASARWRIWDRRRSMPENPLPPLQPRNTLEPPRELCSPLGALPQEGLELRRLQVDVALAGVDAEGRAFFVQHGEGDHGLAAFDVEDAVAFAALQERQVGDGEEEATPLVGGGGEKVVVHVGHADGRQHP